jgi:hypothetical protein
LPQRGLTPVKRHRAKACETFVHVLEPMAWAGRPLEMRRLGVATLIERAASVVRNSLHRSWHAREQGAEPYGLPADGLRLVMSDLGMAAYDIGRRGADQRAIEGSLHASAPSVRLLEQ